MQFDKLIKLIGRLDEKEKECFELGLSSFFGKSLSPDGFAFGEHELNLVTLEEKLGETVFRPLFMCAVEFFLSNEYPLGFSSWNAIDYFLKKRGPLLPTQDKMYLKGLRDSYMSLYEVIDVKLDQSITIRNLLEDSEPAIVVKEKMGTHCICQWDLLGARIIRTPKVTLFAGGLLLLDREVTNAAKETIEKISKVMMSAKNLRLFQKETKDPALMIKKMWVKEIAQNWFIKVMEDRKKDTPSEELTSGLSKEEEGKLIGKMFDQHYHTWIDSPLPFLNHKTPREAVKTKKGLQQIIDRLKDMENNDIRAVKQGSRDTLYNFDWIYVELGIEKKI